MATKPRTLTSFVNSIHDHRETRTKVGRDLAEHMLKFGDLSKIVGDDPEMHDALAEHLAAGVEHLGLLRKMIDDRDRARVEALKETERENERLAREQEKASADHLRGLHEAAAEDARRQEEARDVRGEDAL